MAYSSGSGPHPGEISPTLTNPEMILPYEDFELPENSYRADSLGDDWRSIGSGSFSIGPSHGHMMATTTPIIYGNGTMLSDIGEVTEAESTPGRKLPGPAERRMLKQAQHNNNNSLIRSSPTMGYNAVLKRTKTGSHQRKISIESTSTVRSEGQAAEHFKDFDDGVSVDDSVFQGDDEESVADSYTEGVIASETHRLSRNESDLEKDDDGSSSAALSRRAEQILLNAKMRLNNMEGNLTRARSSLFVTPIHSSSPLSRSTPSPPVNGLRVTALGVPPSKHRQLHTPNDSPATSPGHVRVQSENSISTPLRTAPFSIRFPVRASSAAARYNGRGGTESSEPSPPLSHTPESPKEDARNGTRSGYSSSLSRTSPPHGLSLEPLNEDEALPEFEIDRTSRQSSLDGSLSPFGDHRGLTRSASTMQMRDLRDQMSDLKGRLSVLRDRARDDTMKRRSLQSLRTPSPFTAAEQWYATSKSYGDSPLSADGGVAQPPWKDQEREEAEANSRLTNGSPPKDTPNYADSEVTSIYEDVAENHEPSEQAPLVDEQDGEEEEEHEAFDTAAEDEEPEHEDQDFENDYNDEMVDRDEVDDYESDASMYHDTVAVPISHEDREDAFDYEHFFLHSAMGTISQQRLARRGSGASFSSEDSVETTRGPAVHSENHRSSKGGKERLSFGHLRSDSTDTVSTMATFATAEEGFGSDNEDEQDHDDFAVQFIKPSTLQADTGVVAKRATFGGAPTAVEDDRATPDDRSSSSLTPTIHDKEERNGTGGHRPSVSSFDSLESTGTTRSFPLVNKPKASSNPSLSSRNSVSSFIGSSASFKAVRNEGESPVSMLAREDQILVERLVASLGQCVLGLQEAGYSTYEGRVWRRRLDAARRVLEGQEGAI